MAEIVILNRWRDKHARRPEIRIGEQSVDSPAQLLLFTGVRYERLDTVQPSKAQLFAEQN